jgi:hypothetical protein
MVQDASLRKKLSSRALIRFSDLKVETITSIEIYHLIIETGFCHFGFEVLKWREEDVVVTFVSVSIISPRDRANIPGVKSRVLPWVPKISPQCSQHGALMWLLSKLVGWWHAKDGGR